MATPQHYPVTTQNSNSFLLPVASRPCMATGESAPFLGPSADIPGMGTLFVFLKQPKFLPALGTAFTFPAYEMDQRSGHPFSVSSNEAPSKKPALPPLYPHLWPPASAPRSSPAHNRAALFIYRCGLYLHASRCTWQT